MATYNEDGRELEDSPVIDERIEEITERFVKNIKKSASHLEEWREESRQAFDDYAGKQWTDEEIRELEKQKRPPVVFNLTMRNVNYLCGLEVQNRQEAKLYPRRVDSVAVSDLGNDTMKCVRDICDAEDEDSESFRDAVITGLGFSEIKMDYDENPDGDIKISRIDPLEIFYDPTSSKKNLVDRKWICHKTFMTLEDIEERWGKDVVIDLDAINLDEYSGQPHVTRGGDQYSRNTSSGRGEKYTSGKIPVYHYQEFEKVCIYRVINPLNGQIETLDEKVFEKLKESKIFSGLKYVKIPGKKYMQHFFVGNEHVEENELKCGNFTINAVTGYYDRNRNYFYGLPKVIRDPQKWKNKFFSQMIHMFNTNAKGGLIIEEGVVSDISALARDWARSDAIIEVSPGGLQRMQTKEMPAFPVGLERLMQSAEKSIMDVAGISEESLGMASREQPFVLEHLRQKQGTIQHAQLFDSFRRFRKIQARLTIKYIQEYIADGRIVRITGQQGPEYVKLMRQNLSAEYDVVIADAPTSPNMRERVFEILMQIIPMALQAGIPVPPEVLDYAPLPESLSTKWKQRISQPDPTMQQLQQLKLTLGQLEAQQTYLENQKIAAEVGRTMSEIPLNQAKAEQASSIGADESMQAAQKMGIAHNDMMMKQKELYLKQAMDTVDMLMTQKRKMEEAKLSAAVKLAMRDSPSSSQPPVMQ